MTGDVDMPLTPDSAAVMKYLDMYQAIISRMAGNSLDCKKWAVALVGSFVFWAVWPFYLGLLVLEPIIQCASYQ